IAGQTATNATIIFGTPAPPGGGRLFFNPTLQSTGVPITFLAVPIPAGDVGVSLFGGHPSGAQLATETSWLTDVDAPEVADGMIDVAFSVPAPPGGGTLYLSIVPLPQPLESGEFTTLQQYLDELRRLLHDETDLYWSQGFKTQMINRALKRRDVDTMANRQIIPFVLTVGKDTYTFSDLGGFGSFPYAPIPSVAATPVPWFPAVASSRPGPSAFFVDFSVPAPPGGAHLWWSVPLVAATGAVTPFTTRVDVPAGATRVTVNTPAP